MATISLTQISNGDNGDATTVDNNFDTIANEVNGNLDNANLDAAAAIDFSKLATAAWTTWATTYSGFSVNPTQTLLYNKVGRIVTIFCGVATGSGTSNATTFTMTLPYAAVAEMRLLVYAIDNTSNVTTGRADTAAASTTLTLYTSLGALGWTASGSKYVSFCFSYPSTS